jgi:hypothetical protein
MSEPVVTATPEMSIAQADLATKGCRQETADVVERISQPRVES